MSDIGGQSLMDFMDAPVLVGDPEGYVVFANKAFVRDLTANGESPHGEPLASLFAGGGREAVLASVAEVCAKGDPVNFRIREGGRGYLVLASPIQAENSRVGVVILLTDEPSMDNRLLDFHREIQEPLDETRACLEELLEVTGGRRDECYREMVERSSAALGRARKWSDELHGLLCGGSGNKAELTQTLQLGRVVRQVVDRMEAECERATISLTTLISTRVADAKGDATLLETALVRILKQRVAQAPAGCEITLLAREVGGATEPGILISVVDPGALPSSVGASDENADAEPGEQTRMVREIVKSLGGEITTVSEAGAGRVTAIWLERARG
ncbi:MAG: hypothetical protein ACI9QQ_000143 [Myxococcota bacterium]